MSQSGESFIRSLPPYTRHMEASDAHGNAHCSADTLASIARALSTEVSAGSIRRPVLDLAWDRLRRVRQVSSSRGTNALAVFAGSSALAAAIAVCLGDWAGAVAAAAPLRSFPQDTAVSTSRLVAASGLFIGLLLCDSDFVRHMLLVAACTGADIAKSNALLRWPDDEHLAGLAKALWAEDLGGVCRALSSVPSGCAHLRVMTRLAIRDTWRPVWTKTLHTERSFRPIMSVTEPTVAHAHVIDLRHDSLTDLASWGIPDTLRGAVPFL